MGRDEPVGRIPQVDDQIQRDRICVEAMEVDQDIAVGLDHDHGPGESRMNPKLVIVGIAFDPLFDDPLDDPGAEAKVG